MSKTTDNPAPPYAKRKKKTMRIGALIPKEALKVFRRRGFAESEIITRWEAIVGEVLGRVTCPDKLSFPPHGHEGATLRIRALPGWATEVQHLAPAIIEKVNAYFGYKAVVKISLVQATFEARIPNRPKQPPKLSREQEKHLQVMTEEVQDPEIKASLQRLGRLVIARNQKSK